ncbi:MAG: LamG-like jellyroll fold domain-containing protein [Candidatus Hydrogenedentota bacterium]
MKSGWLPSYAALLAVVLAACILGAIKGAPSGEVVAPDTANAFRAGTCYIEIPDTGDLLKDRASLTFWVKLNRATPEAERFGIHHISAHGGISHYPWTDGLAYFNTFRDSRVDGIELSDDIDREQWHLVTITSEPGENGWKLYQNTERVHQTTGAESIHTGARFLLGASKGGTWLQDGYLHDVRLYNRVLTSAEIADLLRGSHVVDGLVAHWPLEGGMDKVVKDSVGNKAGRLIDLRKEREFDELRRQIADRSYWNDERLAREVYRPEALIREEDRTPVDVVWRRTHALLEHLQGMEKAPDLTLPATALEELREHVEAVQKQASPDETVLRRLFDDITTVRRRIAFANPLLDFEEILFIKRNRARGANAEHMVDQYFGIYGDPGGGLYVLEDPFGDAPRARDLLAGAVVERGRLQGQPLHGGAFLSPSLSFDGEKILFAYVERTGSGEHRHHTNHPEEGYWDREDCYHIFKVNRDGTGLEQLTDGTWNDHYPIWTPGGRIVFTSERRGGYLRCGRVCPTYTLHDMAADGSDIRTLSFHETNEWHPSVAHDGAIMFTRWDYVDRHGCVAHHPWTIRPDGTDPRSVHGNFSFRHERADMQVHTRKIPGSHRYVAVAAPHHGQSFGSLVLFDPRVPDDDGTAPVRRLTPDIPFPESQASSRNQHYGQATPLSEDFYLTAYDPGGGMQGDYGLYLLDSFGNRELLYRDPAIGSHHPIPLRPRPVPPALPDRATRVAEDEPAEATVGVVDVYNSKMPFPEDVKVSALRIKRLLPLSVPSALVPHNTGIQIPQGNDSINIARWILGTVPVEEDGSAHFTVPARAPLMFQALDEEGLAITSMRSATQFMPNEQHTCMGCHESPQSAPSVPPQVPLAMRRPPSEIEPEVDGTAPFSYPRLVQPVLDRNCVECHQQNADTAPPLDSTLAEHPGGGHMNRPTQYYTSYLSLAPEHGFYDYGGEDWNDPQWYRTTPGEFGARASGLYHMLKEGHHDVQLSDEEMHRIVLWLDSVSLFYGVYEKEGGEAQLRGEEAEPTLW